MIKIAVISGKGGSGKTAVSVNISCALKMLGKSCLLVDCSFGIRNDDIALGRTTQGVFNLKDVLLKNASYDEVIVPGDEQWLPDFIPASVKSVPDNLPDSLEELLNDISEKYDYVIFDSPSSTGVEFDALTKISDIILAVTTPDVFSVSNTALCCDRIGEEIKKYVVINRFDLSNDANLQYVEDVSDEIGAPIIGLIRDDEFVAMSLISGDPIVRYDTYSGREFENIVKRLTGFNVPFEKKNKIFDRNRKILKNN